MKDDADWSVPETEVLANVRDLLEADQRGVLATIIAVEGSAYRRPGAKMLIPEDGEGIGHITAGCLEDEVQQLAKSVLETGEPLIEQYDLRPETDDDVWGLGVGCNGIIDILLEPIDASLGPMLDAHETGQQLGVLTILEADDPALQGARAFFDPMEEQFTGSIPSDRLEPLRSYVEHLIEQGAADVYSFDEMSVFVDGIDPPADLVVIGTGHDIRPIVELGRQANFRVTVVGFRGAAATPDRFPLADNVRSTSPTRMREEITFDDQTYVILATHNFLDDRLALEVLVDTPVPYIGLMGPRDRFDEILEDMGEDGRTLTEEERARIYTPVGLDLGGGAPHQIAISIIAEVLAIAHGRTPRHLKYREQPIHDRVAVSNEP